MGTMASVGMVIAPSAVCSTVVASGDLGFDGGPNMIQDAHMDDTLYVKNPDSSALLLDDPTSKSHKPMDIDFNAAHDDGFGDGMADFGRLIN